MKNTILVLLLLFVLSATASAQESNKSTAAFDKVVDEELPLDQSGATVLVSRRGQIVYKKGFGKANVELNVPMQADHVFRIASITKQFTAIAILQLMEEGKLDLQDDITRFLPAYPTHGVKITIEHLLTHTSGIRDYASMKDTVQRGKLDFTPQQMIGYFQDQPLRFAPGTRYEYSNSNYFLLGYIIEKVTGKTYGQYLEDHFFGPLQMRNSFYGSDTRIIRNRASGYTQTDKGLENAAAMSMSQPYAAGAILSTVEDLYKWNRALQSYKLVKKETLQKAWTRYKLADGTEINYGYGFRFGFIQQSRSIWHGGLINGFFTMAMYLPQEDVYVVVLSNCNCVSPERVTAKLAAVAIGKPYSYKEIAVENAVLQTYARVYENEAGDQLLINTAEGKLYLQRGNGPRMGVKAFEKDKFFFEDGIMTMQFSANNLVIQTRNGNEVWKKSAKSDITQTEIKPDEKVLDLYTGSYEVTPQFTFAITREKDRLYLQATGQEKLEIFAEASDKFFLKVNDARLQFIMESGKVTKAILKQGGRTTDAVKVK
jgi:CubicO group peptidase (beta-lactamase class C family)